jgi:hypothetical protein
MIRINCIYNDDGAWCKNKKIKRSMLGLGARCCVIYPYGDNKCDHLVKYTEPPSPPPKRKLSS